MITIRHDHENGTLVYGTEKGDGVYELIGPRTAARFRYFPSIRQIGIAQSRDHLAKRYQIDTAAKALRDAGHEVTVEIDDTPRDVADVKADRAGRLDDRAERLTAAAQRNMSAAEQRAAAADQLSQRFAGGQPILVGHHSERGARADQRRIDGHMRASVQHAADADRAARAAQVVGRADAYRDRPAVIIRRIDKTEAELRQTVHYIDGTRPANDWRGAYGTDRAPATGRYLEQLTVRKTFLEHQLDADRAALAAHAAAGYVIHSRDTVHKGDVVVWSTRLGDKATVTRANKKTVTLDRKSWPRLLGYEQIRAVDCPHQGTVTITATGTVAAPPRAPADSGIAARLAAFRARPAEPAEPVYVDVKSQYFPTPPAVAALMIDAADLAPGMTVLEPSAGLGAIAKVAAPLVASVDCVDDNGVFADALRRDRFVVTHADFLAVPAEPRYDRVLMNPPFARQADIAHVTHALGFVRPGGRVVAVMSAGAEFRSDKTATAFRDLVAGRGGWFERLPDDAFAASGTKVRTVLVVIPAPAAADAEPAGQDFLPGLETDRQASLPGLEIR